jgi:pimeloyl-ACP methyl ester carboxylesterase
VARVRELVAQATPHGVAAAQRAMASRPDSTPLLARIRVPTLVVHGLDDRLVNPSEAQAMAAQIPGARFRGIPTAGHLPPLETPEEVTRELRTLVTEVRSAAG